MVRGLPWWSSEEILSASCNLLVALASLEREVRLAQDQIRSDQIDPYWTVIFTLLHYRME